MQIAKGMASLLIVAGLWFGGGLSTAEGQAQQSGAHNPMPLGESTETANGFVDTAGLAQQLVRMNQQELLSLYHQAGAGQKPRGFVRGRLIWQPGCALTVLVAHFFELIWQGKWFSDEGGIVVNRVLHHNRFPARAVYGASWFDGKPAIIIDYEGTTSHLCVAKLRDEMREVAPGLYLGLAYSRGSFKAGPRWFFTLEALPCQRSFPK
jgi:hypothetical protein